MQLDRQSLLSCSLSEGFKEFRNGRESQSWDLKSLGPQGLCGFDSRPPHQSFLTIASVWADPFSPASAGLGNDFGKRRSILSTAVPRFSPLRWVRRYVRSLYLCLLLVCAHWISYIPQQQQRQGMQKRHHDIHGFVRQLSYNVANRISGHDPSQAAPSRNDPENSGNDLL